MHKGSTLTVKPYSRLMHWYRWQSFRLPLFNTLARTAMRFKFTLDPIRTKQQIRLSESAIKTTLAQQPIFFSLSTIRSGSTFLADLLAQELPMAQIEHEPNINDYWSYTHILRNPQHAFDYVADYRLKDLLNRIQTKNSSLYGEFNPFLVLHVAAIKEQIPHARLLHLVRDGRDVVRSIMAREVLGDKDPLLAVIQPPDDDPYASKWQDMSRFERVCWKWRYENRVLRKHIPDCIHFEQLISDYAYFQTHLLSKIGVNISQKQWEQYIHQPQHASPKYPLAHWTQWNKQQKQQFTSICGAEMAACGYSLQTF